MSFSLFILDKNHILLRFESMTAAVQVYEADDMPLFYLASKTSLMNRGSVYCKQLSMGGFEGIGWLFSRI